MSGKSNQILSRPAASLKKNPILIENNLKNRVQYLNAKTKEKVFAVAGEEWGDLEGSVLIIVMALYGLKTSGASFHQHLADTLWAMGFRPSAGDRELWFRKTKNSKGKWYYEYIATYTDDLLAVSEKPMLIMENLGEFYTLKNVGPPVTYLGANIVRKRCNGKDTWGISAGQYAKEAISNAEKMLGKKFTSTRVTSPLVPGYHPEMDQSDQLQGRDHAIYRCLAGM